VSDPGLNVDLGLIAEICRRYGVARLEVFGSVNRGDEHAESDIDVLYELVPGARLGWEVETLADEFAGVLGRPVDLVSRRALHERLRESVLAEARVLYAA
jgi:predicted nucleotidyltransferase